MLDAFDQQQADRAAKAARARRRAVEAAWLQLIRTLWRRVQMDRRFDQDPNEQLLAGDISQSVPNGGAAAAGDRAGAGAGGVVGDEGRKRTAKEALQRLQEEVGREGEELERARGRRGDVMGAMRGRGKRRAVQGQQEGGDAGNGRPQLQQQEQQQEQTPEEPQFMEGVEVEEF